MTATRLITRRVEKPWGRCDLGPCFDAVPEGGAPVGEIWFEAPGGSASDLLVKYLFTAEKLSIQVHPGDEAARARGLARGKSEAWLVLAAEPGAAIGIGLKRRLDPEALRRAVLDGSIEREMDWRPVEAGDFIYLEAGTIHALGAGLTVIEVQQNSDVTYRLYDYGRPRALHVEDAIAAADAGPYRLEAKPRDISPGRAMLVETPAFAIERWTGPGRQGLAASPVWLVPIAGEARLDGETLVPGTAWRAGQAADVEVAEGGDLLVAY